MYFIKPVKFSIIIPVYQNEDTLPQLLKSLLDISRGLSEAMEAVFVVDGSPDQSFFLLKNALSELSFPAQLVAHSRNFGSLAAIRTGLMSAQGEFFAVMAADLQEPPELFIDFFQSLARDECDVVIGVRSSRQDPYLSRVTSNLFWSFYRRFIISEIPKGGVDVFGCNHIFRDKLLSMEESRSSLIILIFWLGFRRKFIKYDRSYRKGKSSSSWSFKKKVEYMMDSIFAFTDYPILLMIRVGFVGTVFSVIFGLVVLVSYFLGQIKVPGYTATLLVVLFFGALNLLNLGLVGAYAWRGYENSKRRPLAIVALKMRNQKNAEKTGC